jgi:hypothetical protein
MEETPPTAAMLATRLAARILHDLAGAGQGLGSALALMSESADDAGRAEAAAFAAASAADLDARLAFCRAAYGGAPPSDADGLERLARIPFAGRRGRLRWASRAQGVPPTLARAMLIFAQLSAAALAGGGEAVASLTQDEALAWRGRVEASGPRLRMDASALCALTGASGPGQGPGRWIDGALARALILEQGGEIEVSDQGGAIILEARLPALAAARASLP